MLITVTGPMFPSDAGLVDAHNHAWIEAVPDGAADAPVLNNPEIVHELTDFRMAGGGAIVDCQPAGCGREGNRLRWLSLASGVKIIAVTGFHRRRYYPPSHWLWQASLDAAREFFITELTAGLVECRGQPSPPKAGLVKIACEATLEDSPSGLMQAAVSAALEAGVAVAVHTEKGAQAERIARQLNDWGLPLNRLILFHMDKRPDWALHQDLAQQGILLEYDTFYREKYAPQENAWPLLEKMVAYGWESQIAVGTDMAEPQMWARLGGAPGLLGWFQHIIPVMQRRGFGDETIRRLTGANIAARLDRPLP